MRPKFDDDRPEPAEAVLLRIAKDGVLTRTGALAAGLSEAVISRRRRTGFLIRVCPGVYRLAGTELTGRTAARAALAATSGYALGMWSASAEHGVVRRSPTAKVHVLVDHNTRLNNTSWYQVHRTRRLAAHELTTRNGLPVTTMARTIRDLAAGMPRAAWAEAQLENWVEEALQFKRMTLPQLERAVRDERAKQVRARLRRLAGRQRGGNPAEFKSIGEIWLRDLIERCGFPMPEFNVRPFADSLTEVDAFWKDVPLIVEFDGFAHHKTRTKFDNDRRRDRRAWRRRVPVIRITEDDFEHDLPALERDLENFLRPATAS